MFEKSLYQKLNANAPVEFAQQIKIDLMNLLNTRVRVTDTSKLSHEVRDSVFNYGVPDIVALQFGTESGTNEFKHHIAHIIEKFEPRLKKVEVKIDHGESGNQGILRLLIIAELDETSDIHFNSHYHTIDNVFNFI